MDDYSPYCLGLRYRYFPSRLVGIDALEVRCYKFCQPTGTAKRPLGICISPNFQRSVRISVLIAFCQSSLVGFHAKKKKLIDCSLFYVYINGSSPVISRGSVIFLSLRKTIRSIN